MTLLQRPADQGNRAPTPTRRGPNVATAVGVGALLTLVGGVSVWVVGTGGDGAPTNPGNRGTEGTNGAPGNHGTTAESAGALCAQLIANPGVLAAFDRVAPGTPDPTCHEATPQQISIPGPDRAGVLAQVNQPPTGPDGYFGGPGGWEPTEDGTYQAGGYEWVGVTCGPFTVVAGGSGHNASPEDMAALGRALQAAC